MTGDPIVLRLSQTIGSEWIYEATRQLDQAGSAIVVQGGTGIFCEGLSLPAAAAGACDVSRSSRALSALLHRLTRDPRPIAAVVEGVAKGGGMGMAVVADMVIARPEASFQLPEVYLGLIPAAALPVVARRVGWGVARRMALGEPPVGARDAAVLGLVDVVTMTPQETLEDCLRRWTCGEAQAIAAVRRLVFRGWPMEEALETLDHLWEDVGRRRVQHFVAGRTPWEEPR